MLPDLERHRRITESVRTGVDEAAEPLLDSSLADWLMLAAHVMVLGLAFTANHYVKYASVVPQGVYLSLLWSMAATWGLASLAFRHSQLVGTNPRRNKSLMLFGSAALSLLLTALLIQFFDLGRVSRTFVLAVTGTAYVGSLPLAWLTRRSESFPIAGVALASLRGEDVRIDLGRMLAGGTVLMAVVVFVSRVRTGGFSWAAGDEVGLIIVLSAWVTACVLTGRYVGRRSTRGRPDMLPSLKTTSLTVLIAAAMSFFLRADAGAQGLLFASVVAYGALDLARAVFRTVARKSLGADERVGLEARELAGLSAESMSSGVRRIHAPATDGTHALRQLADPNAARMADFIGRLSMAVADDPRSTTILSTGSIPDLQVLPVESRQTLVSLQRFNDIKYPNTYLRLANSRLQPGGILLGVADPHEAVKSKLGQILPAPVFALVYPLHFLALRVLPRLPRLRRLYFAATRGRNRVLSRAEILGRVVYTGFSIQAEEMIDGHLFFAAMKTGLPSVGPSPSYGPLIRLQRVGLNGRSIMIRKIRTMHPYSEFLQQYVHDLHALADGGKFENDFRVTGWGRILRKLWLDELPQLLNWLRGEVKLVGVRALSEQYLSMYPSSVRELRARVRPGLFPALYADGPTGSLEGIVESERRYLEAYLERPFTTDVRYFFKGIRAILFEGVRST